MGVLVQRCLCCGDGSVNVNDTSLDKAVGTAVTGFEEHRLTLKHTVLHGCIHNDGVHDRTLTTITQTRQFHIFHLRTPLLAVFVHVIHQHLVIEGSHTIIANAEIFALPIISFLTCHDGFADALTEDLIHRLSIQRGQSLSGISRNNSVRTDTDIVIVAVFLPFHYKVTSTVFPYLIYIDGVKYGSQIITL